MERGELVTRNVADLEETLVELSAEIRERENCCAVADQVLHQLDGSFTVLLCVREIDHDGDHDPRTPEGKLLAMRGAMLDPSSN